MIVYHHEAIKNSTSTLNQVFTPFKTRKISSSKLEETLRERLNRTFAVVIAELLMPYIGFLITNKYLAKLPGEIRTEKVGIVGTTGSISDLRAWDMSFDEK